MKRHPFILGPWRAEPMTRRIERDGLSVSLEPKVMDLLCLLAETPGHVFSRNALEAALWPDITVGEDTVARAVSKLRRALGDNAKTPLFVETIPKRGYRLIAAVRPDTGAARTTEPVGRRSAQNSPPAGGPGTTDAPMTDATPGWPAMAGPGRPGLLPPGLLLMALLLAAVAFAGVLFETAPVPGPDRTGTPAGRLTDRADDLYMHFTRADNEAAIILYERALAVDEAHAPARSGLANALVQRVVRWQHAPGTGTDTGTGTGGPASLGAAVEAGLTQTPHGRETLWRATALAERAVRLAPDDADALKALGLAHAARGDLDRAAHLYRRAAAADRNAWAPRINLGEIHMMRRDPGQAVKHFADAFAAMERSYPVEPQRVGPWQAALGLLIGQTHEDLGADTEAALWYRTVLALTPLEPEATTRLAGILRRSGGETEAAGLCRDLRTKVGLFDGCLDRDDR